MNERGEAKTREMKKVTKEMEPIYITYKTTNNEARKKETLHELDGQPSIDLVPQIAPRDHTRRLCFSNYCQRKRESLQTRAKDLVR